MANPDTAAIKEVEEGPPQTWGGPGPDEIDKTFPGGFMTKHADLSNLRKSWPSPFVARQEIKNFSGGIMSEKYVANLDCQGLGPPGRIKVGRKVAYPIEDLIKWLESRSSTENAE